LCEHGKFRKHVKKVVLKKRIKGKTVMSKRVVKRKRIMRNRAIGISDAVVYYKAV
jgi:hypothetical protein